MFFRQFGLMVFLGVQILVLAGCGGGGSSGGSSANPKLGPGADVTAPTVTTTTPVAGATVAVNTLSISATFSEDMDPATIVSPADTFTVTDITDAAAPVALAGSVTLSGNLATYTLSSDLPSNAVIEARISTAAQDLAGNPLAVDFFWTFNTGSLPDTTAPTITGTSPVDAEIAVDNLGAVTVSFSEDMDPATLNTTTFTVGDLAGTIVTSGSAATFTPAIGMFPGVTYTATVTSGARDLAGNSLAAPFSFSFTIEDIAWGGTKQVGEAGIDESQGVAVDDGGNVYVFGNTDDDLAGPGTNAGGDDLFLIKYDPAGVQQFLVQIGSEGHDLAANVVVDKTGNIYLAGSTGGDLGGTGALLGEDDAFVAKLDPAGEITWIERFGDAAAPDAAIGVQVDGSGNVYVVGATAGDLGGGDPFLFTDAFLAKFDASGNPLWTNQFGTDGIDDAWALALDGAGNIYVVGSVEGDLATGDGGTESDAYLARFDADGNGPVLVDQIGTDGDDFGTGVVVDSTGNIYIGGRTDGDFVTGGLGTSEDWFIAKFTGATGVPDIRQFGSVDFDDALGGLAVDSNDNIYITGEIGGDFNGETEIGLGDGYLVKFDGSLNPIWTRIFGTDLNDFTTRLAVGADNGVYVTGITDGDLVKPNLGPVPSDGFLIKFDADGRELPLP